MALTDELREELHDLLLAAHEQSLSEPQTRRLDQLVCDNLDAAWFYLTTMDTFATLAWHRGSSPLSATGGASDRMAKMLSDSMNGVEFARGETAIRQAGGAEIELPSHRAVPRRSSLWTALRSRPFSSSLILATLAVTLGLALLAIWKVPHWGGAPVVRENERPSGNAVHYAAKVSKAEAASWINGGAVAVGEPLRAGARFHLAAGRIEMETATGAKVVVEAPASFSLETDNAMQLTLGRLMAWAPPAANGFTVNTPAAQAVDRGTEFGVMVAGKQLTEVHVFDGNVDVTPAHEKPGETSDPNAARAHRLEANMAVRVVAAEPNGSGSAVESIEVDRERFSGSRSWAQAGAHVDRKPAKVERYWYSGGIVPSQMIAEYDDPEFNKLIRDRAPAPDISLNHWVGFLDKETMEDSGAAQPRIDFELAPPAEGEHFGAVEAHYYVLHIQGIHAPKEVRVWAADNARFENARLIAQSNDFNDDDFSGDAKKPDWKCVRRIRVALPQTTEPYIRLDFYNEHTWTFLGKVVFLIARDDTTEEEFKKP